jgi:hypothetical protein
MATVLTKARADSLAPRAESRKPISFVRLAWVAPLTVVAAVAVNYAIKLLLIALDPSLASMGQLQMPLLSLTLQGAAAACVVFAIAAALLPRPILWYRILAVVALLASLVPDIALGLGGNAASFGMRLMQPFLSLGMPAPSGAGQAGPPPGAGAVAGGMPATSIEHVLVLVLLHVACFVVCVTMLTTLARRPAPAR